MQITQPELMRIIHQDGIHVRYIHPAFNDIGAYQHVVFTIDEIQNPLLQHMSLHLPVRVSDAEIGTKRLYKLTHLR